MDSSGASSRATLVRLAAILVVLALLLVACAPPPEQNPELFAGTGAESLAEAISEDDADSVRDLIQDGADPNAQGENGTNLLQFAISTRSQSALEALLEEGADPNVPGYRADTAVHSAAKETDPALLRTILANGGDPDARNKVTGETALAQVILVPDTDEQFQMLLDAGADVNAADKLDNIPLHVAGRVNAGAKILTMLEAGADPRKKNDIGATFQEYYFGYDERILNDRAKRERVEIKAWLRENDVPIWDPPSAEETTFAS